MLLQRVTRLVVNFFAFHFRNTTLCLGIKNISSLFLSLSTMTVCRVTLALRRCGLKGPTNQEPGPGHHHESTATITTVLAAGAISTLRIWMMHVAAATEGAIRLLLAHLFPSFRHVATLERRPQSTNAGTGRPCPRWTLKQPSRS